MPINLFQAVTYYKYFNVVEIWLNRFWVVVIIQSKVLGLLNVFNTSEDA